METDNLQARIMGNLIKEYAREGNLEFLFLKYEEKALVKNLILNIEMILGIEKIKIDRE